MIVVENPDTVKHIRNLESAIQRVRDVLEVWSQDITNTTEQQHYNQILKALDGENNG